MPKLAAVEDQQNPALPGRNVMPTVQSAHGNTSGAWPQGEGKTVRDAYDAQAGGSK